MERQKAQAQRVASRVLASALERERRLERAKAVKFNHDKEMSKMEESSTADIVDAGCMDEGAGEGSERGATGEPVGGAEGGRALQVVVGEKHLD